MNAVLINNHHFNEGIKLEIVDGKNKWSINHRYLDPKNYIDDFTLLLNIIFTFTGCWEKTKIIDGDVTKKDVLKHIYDTPLEHNIEFVSFVKCNCKKCGGSLQRLGEIIDVKFEKGNQTTYGEIMDLFSSEAGCKKFYTHLYDIEGHFYEYPDSVHLSIKRITELPQKIHTGRQCNTERIENPYTLNDNQVYIDWSYC